MHGRLNSTVSQHMTVCLELFVIFRHWHNLDIFFVGMANMPIKKEELRTPV